MEVATLFNIRINEIKFEIMLNATDQISIVYFYLEYYIKYSDSWFVSLKTMYIISFSFYLNSCDLCLNPIKHR